MLIQKEVFNAFTARKTPEYDPVYIPVYGLRMAIYGSNLSKNGKVRIQMFCAVFMIN